ncbi:Rv1733c family protein [Streptomyces sp. DSM 118878]
MSGVTPSGQPPPAPGQHEPAHPRSLWRWRHNPLRRRTDLIQGWTALALLLLVPVVGVVAALLVGDTASGHYRALAKQQAQTRHLLTATLTHDAPRHPEPGSDEAKKARYPVTVRYTAPDGRTRTAKADVLPGLSRGSTIDVWADTQGAMTGAPMSSDEIRSRAMGWAVLGFLAVALAGAAADRAALDHLTLRACVITPAGPRPRSPQRIAARSPVSHSGRTWTPLPVGVFTCASYLSVPRTATAPSVPTGLLPARAAPRTDRRCQPCQKGPLF